MRTVPHDTITWMVKEKRSEAPDVETIILETEGERPPFIAGQYLTVLLAGFEPTEGKSYSISSIPRDAHLSLTVKAMGNFSRAILSHKVGDRLTTSLPYGFFHPERDERGPRAFVAGGIGISPILSIIEDLLVNGDTDNLTLFYSNRTRADIVFKKRIDALVRDYSNFIAHHFITREPYSETSSRPDLVHVQGPALNDGSVTYGRMTSEYITAHLVNPAETDFFICGSIDFTKSMWTKLKHAGIPHTRLYTEGFF